MSKTIANGALDFSDESPNVVRSARIEFGPGADSSKGVVVTASGVVHLLYFPANSVILDAKARTITAFATGQKVDIGDTTQSDGLFTSASIAPQTAVTTGILKGNAVSDYFNATGKIGGYALPGARYINATLTCTGATKLSTSSVGKVELFVVYTINGAE